MSNIIADLFDMLLPMLGIYQEYVRNHHYSLQVLAEYKQKPDFNQLLHRYEEKSICEGRSLATFLTYPMHQVRLSHLVNFFCGQTNRVWSNHRLDDSLTEPHRVQSNTNSLYISVVRLLRRTAHRRCELPARQSWRIVFGFDRRWFNCL